MFREELERLVSACYGSIGAVLMGFDGIAVETFVVDGNVDVTTTSTELSFVLTQVKKALVSLELGDLKEVTIRSDQCVVVLRVLTPEYFVALVLSSQGQLGKGRYLLRVSAPKLQAEL